MLRGKREVPGSSAEVFSSPEKRVRLDQEAKLLVSALESAGAMSEEDADELRDVLSGFFSKRDDVTTDSLARVMGSLYEQAAQVFHPDVLEAALEGTTGSLARSEALKVFNDQVPAIHSASKLVDMDVIRRSIVGTSEPVHSAPEAR